MTQRLLVLLLAGWLLVGCNRGLAGTYVRTSPNGSITLTLANGGFTIAGSDKAETLAGTYTIKDNLLTLVIEKRSGKPLPLREQATSPPMLIRDGGQVLEEENGAQFVKQ